MTLKHLETVLGSATIALFVLLLVAVPLVRASDECGGACNPNDDPVSCEDGCQCTGEFGQWSCTAIATCSPPAPACVDDGSGTACDAATNGIGCYAPDVSCKCRARNSHGCNCGY